MRRTFTLSLVLGMMSLLVACANPSGTAPTNDPANAPGGATDPAAPSPNGMSDPAAPSPNGMTAPASPGS
ncbi:MAG TPA: hypothetical protein V6C78_17050 [Crinalium sp.]